jgi:hypothetical protein
MTTFTNNTTNTFSVASGETFTPFDAIPVNDPNLLVDAEAVAVTGV